MLRRVLISLLSAVFFSGIGVFLMRWTWDYSHGPGEPSLLAEVVTWLVVASVFILIGCFTYSLINPHEGQARE
jgi:hypothetical protein